MQGTAQAPTGAVTAMISLYNIYTASLDTNAIPITFSALQFEEGTTATTWVGRDSASISADRISGRQLKSINYSTTAGSLYDLDAGTISLGGSSSPKFSVSAVGEVHSVAGDIGGMSITSSGIYDYTYIADVIREELIINKTCFKIDRSVGGNYSTFDADVTRSNAVVIAIVGDSSYYGFSTNGRMDAVSYTALSDETIKSDIQEVNVLGKLKNTELVPVKKYRIDNKKFKDKEREKFIQKSLKEGNKVDLKHPALEIETGETVEDYNPVFNIGAMAAQFNKAFGLNRESTEKVSLNDQIGVALRAIQELAEIVDAQGIKIAELEKVLGGDANTKQ